MLSVEVLLCGYTCSVLVRRFGSSATFLSHTSCGREMNTKFTGDSCGGHFLLISISIARSPEICDMTFGDEIVF